MLEIRHLTKIYAAKGGAEVKALDDVTVSFPSTGLVFLLGKSGSGKSTLLNLAGGLDSPTSGEIVVMGKSSKDFSGSDFDSYRNTFVGFIFQEYNVLDEFTVEDNIALALELQGKPKDKQKILSILRDVELESFAKRKPNTLSGGQKQRIAIARALVKDPQIIMADEPTGALDSATGKQVFDTLKELSKTRLVIVVSHDREFAEIYGDRIIELKDGKIISDVTKTLVEAEAVTETVKRIGDDTLSIQGGALNEKTIRQIEAFLRESNGEVLLSRGERDISSFRRANRIQENGSRERFDDTGTVETQQYDGKKTKFIRSRLPLGRAIKMGASGLKTKPIRLIFTILLAVVAFIMFGVLSTFMLYDPSYSVSLALQEADYPSVTVQKNYLHYYESWYYDENGEAHLDYSSDRPDESPTLFGVQELKDKNAQGQKKYAGIFTLAGYWSSDSGSLSLIKQTGETSVNLPIVVNGDLKDYYPIYNIQGFTDCGAQYMQENNFSLLKGEYPKDKTEIALPRYMAELIVNTKDSGITRVEDVVGKKVKITLSYTDTIPDRAEFTVSGVYNVGEIPSKYDDLKSASSNLSPDEREKLQDSYRDFLDKSFHTLLYVTEDFYEAYKFEKSMDDNEYIPYKSYDGLMIENWEITEPAQNSNEYYTEETVRMHPDYFKFYDLDGNEKEFSVSDGQLWLSGSDWFNAKSEVYRNLASNLQEMARSRVDEEAYNYFFGGESDWSYIINRSYENMDGLNALIEVINEKYTPIAKKVFIRDLGNMLHEAMNSLGESESYADFIEACERLSYLEYEDKDNGVGEATEADWTLVENTINSLKSDEKYESWFRKFYGRWMYERSNWKVQNLLDAAAQEAGFDSFMNGVVYDLNSPENESRYALLNELIDEWYETITGSKAGEEQFKPTPAPVQWDYYYMDYLGDHGKMEVVGYFTIGKSGSFGGTKLVSESFLTAHSTSRNEGNGYYYFSKDRTDYVMPEDAKYDYIISLTDNTQEEIALALNSDNENVTYKLTNRVYSELEMFLDMITEMQLIFLIVGLVVGVFAALMLLNFISVSISAKKKEIGILRAVGARGSDTFKIFFAESLIIALICFVLASVGSFLVCGMLNNTLAGIVSMQLLDFNVVNILLIFAISIGISFIATFFPVWLAARKKPVESIRAL